MRNRNGNPALNHRWIASYLSANEIHGVHKTKTKTGFIVSNPCVKLHHSPYNLHFNTSCPPRCHLSHFKVPRVQRCNPKPWYPPSIPEGCNAGTQQIVAVATEPHGERGIAWQGVSDRHHTATRNSSFLSSICS